MSSGMFWFRIDDVMQLYGCGRAFAIELLEEMRKLGLAVWPETYNISDFGGVKMTMQPPQTCAELEQIMAIMRSANKLGRMPE